MPHAHGSHGRLTLALAGAAALAGGGALGWWLGPSRPSPPVAATHAAPAKPAPISQSDSTTDLPYDLGRLASGSLQDFVDLDAWLASATCEQVWALLDRRRRPRRLGHSPVLDELVRQRFRGFPVDDRLAVVRAHAEPQRTYLPVDNDILVDLLSDLLPACPADAAGVSKFVQAGHTHGTMMALQAWVRQDFEAALAFAQSLGHPDVQYLALLIGHLAATDLPAARHRVESLPAGAERDQAMVSVAYAMANSNLAEAMAWVMAQGGGPGRIGESERIPATDLLTRVAYTDPASVADVMLQQPALFEGPGGQQAVGDIFARWAAQDPQAAADWLRAHPLPASHQARAETALFVQQLVDLPDDAVLDVWRSQPEAVQKATLRTVAARLAEGDPTTLLDRVAAAFPEDKRRQALSHVLSQVPSHPPDQILRWLPDLVPHFVHNTAHDHLLTSLAPEHLEKALALLPEADRRVIQERTAEALIRDDPARALDALPPVDPNKEDPFVYSHLAAELLKNDPTKASDWVAEFAEGTSKEWAAQNLVASWGKFDPDAATTWVEKLPPGASRDRASVELAFLHGLTGDSAAGVALAAAVQDPDRRVDAAGFALQSLWRRDPDAARAAAATLGLSPEHQQSLTTRLAKGEFTR